MKRLFLFFFSFLFSLAASANDFEVDGIYYRVTSSSDLTVEVASNSYSYEYLGNIVIPQKVT